ncbi:L,D-transpeptidase [Pseudoroseicyclus tamaricis]|uniref:L,D-transpeptidase n=1 Tax=Pseudoroseicyclus tamaricis TaxID=2705421 RepID=A0A6B2JXL7_9RHOB|nr:L,D-transpeptidase [Pseudoroseicyclus tamaricis]NDV02605.1 L,D-transpeptidase [Pseudoroseicyclus tamaricis]
MTSRRGFLAGAAAASLLATPALAQTVWRMPREYRPTLVRIGPGQIPGSIQVDSEGTWLYHILDEETARRYKVAVGEQGRQFRGTAYVGRKAEWPSWRPTASMIQLEPEVYGPFRGGLPGGHEMNPLGARALYLYQDGRDTLFRIHGTPQPWTMGQSFSSGCVRLINSHVEELYDQVPVGTPVIAA